MSLWGSLLGCGEDVSLVEYKMICYNYLIKNPKDITDE
jgi:hypothetical protein